jgi:hypothetical protein
VVANVVLTTGVLDDSSYTAMVIMAMITSAMAAPLLKLGAAARA